MSGHSKWHNIQKTKGAADAKRSAIFTKIAKEIIVAVKEGGGSGDPANNSRLATVIAKAKAANMPNDNIKRTIDKALGNGNTESFEAVTYEGYGPGGVAVIVEALTDNRQRTAPEVRHAFSKCNGSMGAQGCVSWSFDKKGVIAIADEDGELDEDTVMMDAMDCAGVEDFEPEEGCFTITTDPDAFNDVVKALGAGSTENFESVTYEGYGPGGVAVIVEALTDNRNRTVAEVRHYLDKYGKGMGSNGCVSWQFERKGVIIIDGEDLDEETVMMQALEAGAADFVADEGVFEVYTGVEDFDAVRDAIKAEGLPVVSAELAMVPSTYVELTAEDDIKNMKKMLEAMEANDDIQDVWHNWDEE